MSHQNTRFFTTRHKILLALAALMLTLAALIPSGNDTELTLSIPTLGNSSNADNPEKTSAESEAKEPEDDNLWLVKPGDNLSYIFKQKGVPVAELHQIMLADTEYLDLETLQPGMRLGMEFAENGDFHQLTLYRDAARKTTYTRQKDGSYQYKAQAAETYWISDVHRGQIEGSFYLSARRAGLSESEIALSSQLLGYKLNFRRDLRSGDRFTAVISREMTGNEITGQTRIESLSLQRRNKTHYAFRFKGHYYDENANSVTPAFLRWPTQKRYRISSSFNKNRLHPVTKRRSPHHGVDFAVMTGTPVVSTGDGIVRRVGNHPYAGKYIEIDHGGSYTTRYLHLHKILAKRGSRVTRGQKIALSGNTGRSTGPHLHFELHIDGKPVNPVTAEIPTEAAVQRKDIASFNDWRQQQLAVMRDAASASGLQTAQNTR